VDSTGGLDMKWTKDLRKVLDIADDIADFLSPIAEVEVIGAELETENSDYAVVTMRVKRIKEK